MSKHKNYFTDPEYHKVKISLPLIGDAKAWCKQEFIADPDIKNSYVISRIRFIDGDYCEFVFVNPDLATRFKLTWQGL